MKLENRVKGKRMPFVMKQATAEPIVLNSAYIGLGQDYVREAEAKIEYVMGGYK